MATTSSYETIQTDFLDCDALLAALGRLGFIPQRHAEPQSLYGWLDDRRHEKAHVIIKGQQIGARSSDLGFLFNDGRCSMFISPFDLSSGQSRPGQGLGSDFHGNLRKEYLKSLRAKYTSGGTDG
jgi:hypothetical protein